MTATKRLTNADVYAKVTASIVEALELGTIPWQQPWVGNRAPHNAVTGRPYSGANVFVLAFTGMARGYTSSGWLTFQQALQAGCVVNKGERGTPVFWMSRVEKRRAPDAEPGEEPETYFCARLFTVFNVDQLRSLDEVPGALEALRAKADGPRHSWEPLAECERIVTATGAVITAGSLACYTPQSDEIRMPPRERFHTGAAGYYATLFHELGHWTGHSSRLNRDLASGIFGNAEYAAEELVAELCASYCSHHVGLEHVSQAGSYIASWLRALKERPNAFITAASAAQKAADYILGTSPDMETGDSAEAITTTTNAERPNELVAA